MIEFIGGILIGATVAGIVGRGKFMQVQTKLRNVGNYFEDQINATDNELFRERRLTEGLTQELAAAAKVV